MFINPVETVLYQKVVSPRHLTSFSPAANDESCRDQQQQQHEDTHSQSHRQSITGWIRPLCFTQLALRPAGQHLLLVRHRVDPPVRTGLRGVVLVFYLESGGRQPDNLRQRVTLHLTLQPAGGAVWAWGGLHHREAQDLGFSCWKMIIDNIIS